MIRPVRRSEEGFTLFEVMLTSALLLIVVAIILPLVGGSLNIFTDTQVRSDAVDSSQVAFGQIGHDVISGNILYQEAPTPGSGIIHLQTQSNNKSSCVEYQVLYPPNPQKQVGQLQRRTKAPGASVPWTGGWTTVMSGIVNSSQLTGTPPAPPLVFSIPTSGQIKSLVVNLWVQLDTRNAATVAAPENYTSTFTGPAIAANGAAAPSNSEPC